MNPIAIIFWCICSIIGYFISDFNGALTGLCISMTISFIVSIFDV